MENFWEHLESQDFRAHTRLETILTVVPCQRSLPRHSRGDVPASEELRIQWVRDKQVGDAAPHGRLSARGNGRWQDSSWKNEQESSGPGDEKPRGDQEERGSLRKQGTFQFRKDRGTAAKQQRICSGH